MGTVTMEKLPQFTGKVGNGPGFAEFWVRITVVLREKYLHSATKNVIVQEGENVNIIRPIPLMSTAAVTKEAYAKDRSLTAMLMNSITGDAFSFATQKFTIDEQTKDEDFMGLRLYIGLKAKYDISLTRSEVFRKKQEIFNYHFNGNITNCLKELTNKRYYLLAHSKLSDRQTVLFDEGIIQSISMKLPASFNAFVIAQRTVEQYTMAFLTFVANIDLQIIFPSFSNQQVIRTK